MQMTLAQFAHCLHGEQPFLKFRPEPMKNNCPVYACPTERIHSLLPVLKSIKSTSSGPVAFCTSHMIESILHGP